MHIEGDGGRRPRDEDGAPARAGRWDALIGTLEAEAEDIAERYVTRVAAVPAYAASPIPASDVRRTAVRSFAALLRRVLDEPYGPDPLEELEDVATGLGVRRARAGIPLESLMTAIRMDFALIWSRLQEIADDADAPLLVDRASRLWDAVDDYAVRVRTSYTEELARMAAEASSARQDLIAAIFGPQIHGSETRERVLEGLGLAPGDRYAVAVARAEDVGGLRETMAVARRRGEEGFAHGLGADSVAFWRVPQVPAVAAALEDLLRDARCGLVLDVGGLEEIEPAARAASLLARAIEPGEERALTLDRGWTRLARASLAADGVDLGARVRQALEGVRPSEREVVVSTVRTYLETGSVASVAAREFCHRNTVLNRIRRFEELTGIDATIPQDAARLVLAWM